MPPQARRHHLVWTLVALGLLGAVSVGVLVGPAWAWAALGVLVGQACWETREAIGAPRRRPSAPEQPATARPSLLICALLPHDAVNVREGITRHAPIVARGEIGRVVVVCNGDDEGSVRELGQLAGTLPWLSLVHVPDSRSKAENLNYAAGLLDGDAVLLYDADTRAGRLAELLVPATAARGIVQGARLVHPRGGLLAHIVAGEFAVKSLLTYPFRARAFDVAYFGGSAAATTGEVMRALGFDRAMLVEDIDYSLRCALAGRPVTYAAGAYAIEDPPRDWRAWLTQRRRWASGWWQLCQRYPAAVVAADWPMRTRAYWLYLLVGRRVAVPVAASGCLIGLVAGLVSGPVAARAAVAGAAIFAVATLARSGVQMLRLRPVAPPAPRLAAATVVAHIAVAPLYSAAQLLVDISVLIWPARRWHPTRREATR